MSIPEALRQAQRASQSAHIDRSVSAANRLNLADHLRFRQMERMLQQTLEELEQAKARISQLEKTIAERGKRHIAAGSGNPVPQAPASITHPMSIDEIKKLAEMAKRLK